MKRSLLTFVGIIVVSIIFVFSVSNGFGAVLFQEDFEGFASNWVCTNSTTTCGSGSTPSSCTVNNLPSGTVWSSGYTFCGSTTGFGAEWKVGEGRNGGKAMYAYKKRGVPNGYRGSFTKWMSREEGGHQDVYTRWYMKVPPASQFDKSIPASFKLWRYRVAPYGTEGAEIYLNFRGDEISTANVSMLVGGYDWHTLFPVSDFQDGLWHCHELRLRLNDAEEENGVIQYWLDGVLKATVTGLDFGGQGHYLYGVGLGNVSDPDWEQESWSAVAFDDYVVSTEYVGPDGSLTLPRAPTSLRITN